MRCETCEREETVRAAAYMAAEDEANAKGEKYDCPCPPRPDCTHVPASLADRRHVDCDCSACLPPTY